MDVFYLAFANSPDHPLDELKREDAELSRLLEPLAARGFFRLVRDSFADLSQVADKLSLYKKDLVLFQYSGHAGPDQLELLDGSAQSQGIAALLAECPRLKLVLLNGCATGPQVEALQAAQIPLVIATHRPVDDHKAAAFAIQFYRSLSLLDSIEGAFNAARGKVLAVDAQLSITRGLVMRNQQEAKTHSWGLFGLPGSQDAAQWRISHSDNSAQLRRYEPNARLIAALMKALAPYRLEISNMLRDEEQDLEIDIIDKRKAILEALPHPLSELLRYLLAPRTGEEKDKAAYFDHPSPGRLRQTVALYFTALELMVFIMLAQLWDELAGQENLEIPDPTREILRQFLTAEDSSFTRIDHIELIRAIRQVFDRHGLEYFVDELKELKQLVEGETPFTAAYRFFKELALLQKNLGPREAELLCIDAEDHLANTFAHLGFVARYSFTSVKNIDVLKYKHEAYPRYRHSMIMLEQTFVGFSERKREVKGLLDSASVLLLKEEKGNEQPFLNLTPFVIDQNAFDVEVPTLAKLHFFVRYLPEGDTYAFRHIYQIDDLPLLIAEQKNYRVVKAQFNVFAKLVFAHPIQQLLP